MTITIVKRILLQHDFRSKGAAAILLAVLAMGTGILRRLPKSFTRYAPAKSLHDFGNLHGKLTSVCQKCIVL